MKPIVRVSTLVAVLLLGACTTLPSGPGVLVLPGTGKNFDEFRANDVECRDYAQSQIGGTTPNNAAIDNTVANAAIGTAVGAAAGALIGGRGAAGVGAGTGLIVGSAAGANSGNYSGRSLQQRYDFSYQQCMYARGNRIPVSGRFETSRPAAPPAAYSPPPPPSYGNPPPPPSGSGYPPPPPPGPR